VIWNEFNLQDIPIFQRAQQLAWVGPETNFQFPFTVQEVLRMGRFAWGEDGHNLEPYLREMDLLTLEDRPVTQISTGEKQRTLLARAMVTEAPIQCWDEPLSSLDIRHQLEILMKARMMANSGSTILISLHDLRVAHCMDQVVLLDQGNLVASGAPAQVLTPALLRQVFGVLSHEAMSLILELPPK
jgi:iron complex transport system ATP-binding protein